jgi:hypothetical protein
VPDAIRCTTPNSLGCVAQRAVQEARAAPQEEVRGARFVPSRMQAFLNMSKIDPQTRAFLWHVAAKQTEDRTLAEYQTTTQLAPALAETAVPTRLLSEFYEFLGPDPTKLFEARFGKHQHHQWLRREEPRGDGAGAVFLRLRFGETSIRRRSR